MQSAYGILCFCLTLRGQVSYSQKPHSRRSATFEKETSLWQTPFVDLDATAQAELVQKGEASPLELVDATISRVEQLNPQLNAVIHPLFEKARGQARSAELPTGPFRGVPFVMKDLVGGPAGEPLHNGMQLLKNLAYTSPQDTYLSVKFRQAGFISVGRTNTPEWGLMGTTEPEGVWPHPQPLESSPIPLVAPVVAARRQSPLEFVAVWSRGRWRRLATHSSQYVWHCRLEAESRTHLLWASAGRSVGWLGERGCDDMVGPRYGWHTGRYGRTYAWRSVQRAVSIAPVLRGSWTTSRTIADWSHAANARQCLSTPPGM